MSIAPNDPRHGRNRGYVAGCHEACCRAAHAEHHKGQRTRRYLARVDRLTVDGLFTRRRIQALMALGWSSRDIDRLLDRRPTYTYRVLSNTGPVYLTTATLYRDLYARLSATRPDTPTAERRQIVTRNINGARRRGYVPPAAWDDIDDPAEDPHAAEAELQRWVRWWTHRGYPDIDDNVVRRLLDHQRVPAATWHERDEAMRRWKNTGRSEAALCAIHGWKEGRYGRTNESDAA